MFAVTAQVINDYRLLSVFTGTLIIPDHVNASSSNPPVLTLDIFLFSEYVGFPLLITLTNICWTPTKIQALLKLLKIMQ